MGDVLQEKQEETTQKKIDYKIVTFALGGKEYAIDIMKVGEILREHRFTMVPNTLPFVKGVYNLRGEIIPIIDLREMFLIKTAEEEGDKDILILKLDDLVVGVIVDAIDKVLGVSSEDIEPPHPLFSDINVKYISGVVESEGTLYIILDVERIFGKEEVLSSSYGTKELAKEKVPLEVTSEEVRPEKQEDLEFGFIKDTLVTLKSFYVTDLNYKWSVKRYSEWVNIRKSSNESVQLKSIDDANEFLKPFYSKYTGLLWGDDYYENFLSLLPEEHNGIFQVWDIGCGKGHESYSLACILRIKYTNNIIKIWADDIDLLSISTAPNLIIRESEAPKYILDNNFIEKSKNGFQFKSDIKDLIVFQYHDVRNINEYPDMDLIVARDLLSFMSLEQQLTMLREFNKKLKPGGFLMLGDNEIPMGEGWSKLSEGNVVLYKKI